MLGNSDLECDLHLGEILRVVYVAMRVGVDGGGGIARARRGGSEYLKRAQASDYWLGARQVSLVQAAAEEGGNTAVVHSERK